MRGWGSLSASPPLNNRCLSRIPLSFSLSLLLVPASQDAKFPSLSAGRAWRRPWCPCCRETEGRRRLLRESEPASEARTEALSSSPSPSSSLSSSLEGLESSSEVGASEVGTKSSSSSSSKDGREAAARAVARWPPARARAFGLVRRGIETEGEKMKILGLRERKSFFETDTSILKSAKR